METFEAFGLSFLSIFFRVKDRTMLREVNISEENKEIEVSFVDACTIQILLIARAHMEIHISIIVDEGEPRGYKRTPLKNEEKVELEIEVKQFERVTIEAVDLPDMPPDSADRIKIK